MRLKKKTVKWVVWILLIILVLWGAFKLFGGPSYPDLVTPKAVFGNPDAKVKIVEYGDIQCPACGAAHPVVQQVKREFGNQISYVYFHFPLRAIHPYAQKAAEAAECANDQGRFFEFLDVAYKNQKALTVKDLKIYAVQIGLDSESFNSCLVSGAKKGFVEADYRQGIVKNIQATPTFFINGELVDNWKFLPDLVRKELG